MYDKNDPRAALQQTAPKARTEPGLIAEEQFAAFDPAQPDETGPDGDSHYLRGNNFVLVHTRAHPGGRFVRAGQPDEYVVLLPNPTDIAEITAGPETRTVPGHSIAFVPPGDSCVTLPRGGSLIRLFTAASEYLVAKCPNASAYDTPRRHIPPFVAWPEPVGGWKIRSYSLDVPSEPGRFGRIFRCTTFMVNMLDPLDGPRDTARMSPHHHDDFEQCSLALDGAYLHHLRWPWTTDMADWRDDLTVSAPAPSALVIPPPVIHTSRAVDPGRNQLVDIFCPPRTDFSRKPGWVLNAADYPLAE